MATSAQLLNQIQEKTKEQLQNNEAAFIASQSGANAAAALSTEAARKLREAADAQVTIIRETDAAKAKVEQAQRTAALAAGYDPSTGTGEIFKRIEAINKKSTEVIDLTKKLRAENAIKLWENPVAWVQANFLSDTEDQLASAGQELQNEATILTNLNAAVQQTARTAEATAQTVTAAKTEAAAKVASTEAQLKAIQAEQEGIRYRTAVGTARAELTQANLSALYNERSAVMAEQNYRLNLAQEERARQQFVWSKERAKIEDELRGTKTKVDEYILDVINTGNVMRGHPKMTLVELQAMQQVGGKEATDKLQTLYQIGMSQKLNPKNPIVGTSPAETYDNLVKLNWQVTEAQKPVLNILKEARDTLKGPGQIDPKTGQPIPEAYNKVTAEVFNSYYNIIKPNGDNPFDVGDVGQYIKQFPDLQNTGLAKAVLNPLVANGDKLTNPKAVIDLGIAAVKDGKMDLNTLVRDITFIYAKSSAVHQGAAGLVSFGIVPPGGGLNYNARLEFGSVVDLTDPVAVGRYISINLAQKMGGTFRPGPALEAAQKDYSGFGKRPEIK